MAEHRDGMSERRLDEETMTTGLQGLRRVETPGGSLEPHVSGEPPAYVKEPLFSKKVMVAWAAGAFIVWFFFTMIVPEIVREVKSAVVTSMEQPGSNTATKTVIRTRNGITITRSERGVTIERSAPSAAGLPVPPPVPAKAPEPAAPAADPVTGKK